MNWQELMQRYSYGVGACHPGIERESFDALKAMHETGEALLKRAADKLQDYCTEINGDLNDSLSTEIEAFLTQTQTGTL